MQILTISRKASSQSYHEKLFGIKTHDSENISVLSRSITLNTTYDLFQYEILYNVLFLNKRII